MSSSLLSSISCEELSTLLKATSSELRKRISRDQLSSYRPYPKQAEFHAAGAQHVSGYLWQAIKWGKRSPAAWNGPCI